MEFLLDKTGDQVTTRYVNPPQGMGIHPSQKWVILKKLSEHPVPVLPKDAAEGMGPAFTSGRYLCRRAGPGNEDLAFMRIYKQIPQTGTEHATPSVRQQQAVGRYDHVELIALRHMTDNRCTATPRLFGWEFEVQGPNDLVPGGYIVYCVWEKVPGDPLNTEKFWSLPYNQRAEIRNNFKIAYSFVTE